MFTAPDALMQTSLLVYITDEHIGVTGTVILSGSRAARPLKCGRLSRLSQPGSNSSIGKDYEKQSMLIS